MRPTILPRGETNAEGKPVVGVTSMNRLADWAFDEIYSDGIDLQWLAIVDEVTAEVKAEYERGDAGPDAEESDIDAEIERRLESVETDGDSSSILFGDWKKDTDGRFTVDADGPQGFAAHYTGFAGGNVSVEYSKHVTRCHYTSPCFVMSDGSGPCGDLDTKGTARLAYTLPANWFRSEGEDT